MYISKELMGRVYHLIGRDFAIKARSIETIDSFTIIEHIQMIPSVIAVKLKLV